MSLRRQDMPLSTFDPRYRELILRGARERLELRQESRKDAQRLRNILTTFRARMRDVWKDKDDTQWEPLYGAIIGVSEDGYSTVIRPRAEEAGRLLGDMPPTITAPILANDPLAEFAPIIPPDVENKS